MSKNYFPHAFQLLLNFRELGTTDARNVNTIIPKLDGNGSISKKDVIALLFAQSKDPDAAYRNFLSRIQTAIIQAIGTAEEQGKSDDAKVLRSIEISKVNASKASPGEVRFFAVKPDNSILLTVNGNQAYRKEDFVPSSGVKQVEPYKQAVSLFISYASNDKFVVDSFMQRFSSYCEEQNKGEGMPLVQWSDKNLQVGVNFDQTIKKSLQESDYGLALLTDAFFDSQYITEVELEYLLSNEKLLPIGLSSKINGKNATSRKFRKHILQNYPGSRVQELFDTHIFYLKDRKGDFYEDCDDDGQLKFIKILYEEIQKKIVASPKTDDDARKYRDKKFRTGLSVMSGNRCREYSGCDFIDTLGERGETATNIEKETRQQLRKDDESKVNRYETLTDMFDWLDDEQSSLYALLGDYGMGKTFTCRMFALQLAERCEKDTSLPRPIYMDLRDVPTFVNVSGVTRQPTLEEMIATVLRFSNQEDEYTSKEIIEAAGKGKQLIIFDGLDEKLVYYSKDMRSQFLRELLRLFPQGEQQNKAKIVISCRSHHFETLSEMDSFLLGLGRSGVQGKDYRVLNLLPFSSSQILQLLTKLLGADDANKVFSFIEDEQYLKDLAKRPFMLTQLSRALPELQKLKNCGLPINAAGFYEALINDSLNRDEEKHIIKPRHKRELLVELAAEFWQNSTQKWQIDNLNDWFCSWLHSNPVLATQYAKEDGLVLEKDLRNSTLLVRFGDSDFGFSHSSMQEFFLSKYFLNHWQNDEHFALLQPVSSLTKRFMFDNLAMLRQGEQARLNLGLAKTLAEPWSSASELALEIIRELALRGLTTPTLKTIDLRGANVSQKELRGLRGETLLLEGCSAHNSRWYDCNFTTIELKQGNISGSLFQNCQWKTLNSHQNAQKFLKGITLADCRVGSGTEKAFLPFGHSFPTRLSLSEKTDLEIHSLNDLQLSHTFDVMSCSFSPDGTRILSGSFADSFKLRDLEGHCLQTFEGHQGWVTSCSFSPDGTRILSASYDESIKLWDLEGHCLHTFEGHQDMVTSCSFSPDGTRILSASYDESVKLWDLEGHCLHSFEGHQGWVTSCSFSPDGTRILSASADKSVKLWDLEGHCLYTFEGHQEGVTSCSFSPDETRILSASDDESVKLWDLEGHCLHTFEGHQEGVTSCSFSPDGTRILSASGDESVKLWDLEGHCLHSFEGHQDGVTSCSFSPDGTTRILSASYDESVKLWDLEGHCLLTYEGIQGRVTSCSFSPDGTRILSGSWDNSVKLWDLEGHCLHSFEGHQGRVDSCSFSPDGTRILSDSGDNSVKLWDLEGHCLQTFEGHQGWVDSCSFSPDGTRILSGSGDESVKLWDLEGHCLQTFEGHEGRVASCSFSPDGTRILSGSWDNSVKLWDLEGHCLHSFEGHQGWVTSCSFSPDGTRILSGSWDNSVKLWDLEGHCLHSFEGHQGRVDSCSFSPDGTRILSASADKSVKLWDLEGHCLHTFEGHQGGVTSCSFSPDGKKIVSGGDDGSIRIWDIKSGSMDYLYSSSGDQWFSARFHKQILQKITGTELSWRLANFSDGEKASFLDDLECFAYQPGFKAKQYLPSSDTKKVSGLSG